MHACIFANGGRAEVHVNINVNVNLAPPVAAGAEPKRAPQADGTSPEGAAAAGEATKQLSSGAGALTLQSSWRQREALAAETGEWLGRALVLGATAENAAVGECPQERMRAKSRIWAAFTDANGCPLKPAVVSWTKALLIDIIDGDAVSPAAPTVHPLVVGFASQREAKVCVSSASAAWPAVVLD